MRTLSLAVLIGVGLAIAGCGDSKTASEKEFEKLYRQYSSRYHEKMVTEAEQMNPQQVTAEAARMWDDVFGPHKDLVKKRCEEILANLPTAPTIKEDQFYEVISGTRNEAEEKPGGVVLKQFVWNPISAASMALNNTLARLLNPNSYAARSVLVGNANLFWDAIDRNVERPKLMQQQGPLRFIVELSRKDDYYQVEKIRWLRPKSMGPIEVQRPPAEGEKPGEKPGEKTAPKTGEKTGEKPAEKPAPKAGEKEKPAEKEKTGGTEPAKG